MSEAPLKRLQRQEARIVELEADNAALRAERPRLLEDRRLAESMLGEVAEKLMATQRDADRLERLASNRLTLLEATKANLERVLDASPDGGWMAEALDAERSLAEERARADKLRDALGDIVAFWSSDADGQVAERVIARAERALAATSTPEVKA